MVLACSTTANDTSTLQWNTAQRSTAADYSLSRHNVKAADSAEQCCSEVAHRERSLTDCDAVALRRSSE